MPVARYTGSHVWYHQYICSAEAWLQGQSIDGVPAAHNPVLQDMLDLRPYIDSSSAAVQESFSVERTYVVFRTLGLRHLVVVDRHNHVKGIVTRKVRVRSFALCQSQAC